MSVALYDQILHGEALLHEGRADEALQFFESLLSVYPDEDKLLNNAGVAATLTEDVVRAAGYFERALETSPASEGPFYNLLDTLLSIGEADLAREVFERYHAGLPESDTRDQYLALLFPEQAPDGSVDASDDALNSELPSESADQVGSREPVDFEVNAGSDWSNPERLYLASLNCALQGHIEQAIQYLDRALSLKPDEPELPFEILDVLIETGAIAPAASLWMWYEQQIPDSDDKGEYRDRIIQILRQNGAVAGVSGALKDGTVIEEWAERMAFEYPTARTYQDSSALVILGMHRSGTSVITNVLHEGGIYAGAPEDHIPPGCDNPKGFWELQSLVDLNRQILFLAGGNWDNPPRAEAIEAVSVLPRAENVFSYFAGHRQWAIKDPRLCLTLPVLAPVLPKDTKLLILRRSPDAIAQSLFRRNGIPIEKGLELTRIYWSHLEGYASEYERLEIEFEDLFSSRRAYLLRQMEEFTGAQDLSEACEQCFLPELIRNRPALQPVVS